MLTLAAESGDYDYDEVKSILFISAQYHKHILILTLILMGMMSMVMMMLSLFFLRSRAVIRSSERPERYSVSNSTIQSDEPLSL